MNGRIKKALIIIAFVVAINIALTYGKLYVGLATNSICVLLDATNSFFDVLTGIITLLAFILALRPHKLGYGRAEYLATFIVAAASLLFGALFGYRSMGRLTMPEPVWSDWVSILIISLCVPMKLGIAISVYALNKKLKSPALSAITIDSFLDTGVTAASLMSFTLSAKIGYTIDAWFGIVISVVIIISAVKLLIEYTKRLLVGNTGDLGEKLKSLIETDDLKAGDITFHDYGCDNMIADVEVEFVDGISYDELTETGKNIKNKVYEELGVRVNLIPIKGEKNE